MMNTAVPHFVIVNDGDDGEGSETIHTAVTDKTGIQKLVTLSEVSSMQEELPTDSTPESKASKGQYKCSHCVKSFVLQKSLRRHKKKAHPGIPEDKEGDVLLTDAANRSSEQCIVVQDLIVPEAVQTRGRLLVKDEALAASLAEELKSLTKVTTRKKRKYEISKEHECPWCSKRFATPSLLRRHHVVHTGEKPYQCQLCGKKYSQAERLRRHMGTHTGINIFKCKVCGKQFEEKCRYIDHVRSHIEEKPFECDICGKVFACRVGLWKHSSIHTGDKRYYGESCGAYRFSCQQCSKQFRLKQDLIRHNRTHTGEAPSKLFPCQFCEKKFSRKVLLETHVRGHTGERPFVCQYCFKRFACKRSLACHIKLHKLGKARPLDGCDVVEASNAKEPSLRPADTVPKGVGKQFNTVQDFQGSASCSAAIVGTVPSTEHVSPSGCSYSANAMPVREDLTDTAYAVANSVPNEKQPYSLPITVSGVTPLGENLVHAADVSTSSVGIEKQPYSIPVTMTEVLSTSTGEYTFHYAPPVTQETTDKDSSKDFQYQEGMVYQDIGQASSAQTSVTSLAPVAPEDYTNIRLASQVPLQHVVFCLPPERTGVEHMTQQGMTVQPVPQEGILVQPVSQQGMTVQHVPMEGIVVQPVPRQSMAVQHSPHKDLVVQPIIQEGMAAHLVPLEGVAPQPVPQEGIAVQPVKPEDVASKPGPHQGMIVQHVVGCLEEITFQALGQSASLSSVSKQNSKTSSVKLRTGACAPDEVMHTVYTRNTTCETLPHTEVQSGITHTVSPTLPFSAGSVSAPTHLAPHEMHSVVETETSVFPAVMQTTSAIETVPPTAILNIRYAGLNHDSQPMTIVTSTGAETAGQPRRLMAQKQIFTPSNQSSSYVQPSLTAASENVIPMLHQSRDITVMSSDTLSRNERHSNQDPGVSQSPKINQAPQSVETYQIVIGEVSKDQPLELVQEDVSVTNAHQVFQQENVVTIAQEVADVRDLRSSSDLVCDIITSGEGESGENILVYHVDPVQGTLENRDKRNPPQSTSRTTHRETSREVAITLAGSKKDESLPEYSRIEDQIRRTLNDGSYPDRASSFAPVELLEEFMPAKRARRKSV